MAVYMIRAGMGGDVKIGLAADPLKRLKALQTSNTAKLRLIRVLDGEADAEKALHRRFAALRKSGEWFAFAPEMLAKDIGYSDLPIPKGKREGTYPETAYGRRRALHDEVRHCVGGFDAIARRIGVAPWIVADWDGLDSGYFSAAVLVMRDQGHDHITIDMLWTADEDVEREEEARAREATDTENERLHERHESCEKEWIKKHGAAGAWWELYQGNQPTEPQPVAEPEPLADAA
jgi:hypothetical protein